MAIKAKNIIIGNTEVEEFVAPQPPKIKEYSQEMFVPKDTSVLRKKFKKEKEHGLLFHHGEKSPYHMDMLTKENE
mgnify:CR=1 FL=1